MNVTAKPTKPVEMGAHPAQSWLVARDKVDMTRPAPPVWPLSIAAEP
jgi:ureidoacrylate peracid hydrolase